METGEEVQKAERWRKEFSAVTYADYQSWKPLGSTVAR